MAKHACSYELIFLAILTLAAANLGFADAQSASPPGPTPAPSAVFSDLSSRAATLKTFSNSSSRTSDLSIITKSLKQLTQVYSESPSIHADYLKSLIADRKTLESAQDAPATEAAASIAIVAADLNAKAKYSVIQSRSGGFADVLGSEISLSVISVRDGSSVNGYDVLCNPRRFADSSDSMYPFGDQTSPATRTLPPGVFTIKLLKAGHVVASKDVELGSDGKTSSTVTISVP